MIIKNRLDMSFGSTGMTAGIILFVVGLFFITTFSGIIIILIGAFMAFTHSGVEIDSELKEATFYNKLFGLIKMKKTRSLNEFDHLSVSQTKRTSKTYSQGNRSLTLNNVDFRVYIVNPGKKSRYAIKKCKSKELAEASAEELSNQIGLPFLVKS